MRVAIIDVGSNTVRLLVADGTPEGLEAVRRERAYLGLGEEIELSGLLGPQALWRAAAASHEHARLARELDAHALEVVVTAPGRQSKNGDELVSVLAKATGAPVRLLSADEEGELAYRGAVSRHEDVPGPVAVCDLGGGSTEIAVGTPDGGLAWLRSFELGVGRLTRRHVDGRRPGRRELEAIHAEVTATLRAATPPLPKTALAAGGTARALGKIVGRRLGPTELAEAAIRLRELPGDDLAKRYAIDPARVRTLPAGTIVLSAVQALLETPLLVARGGVREGAALALLARTEAAAA
jgi:exopolyphosphatase/guanosine-5'-triphosphate,3'-diphosphate pyrophosphatase